MASDYKSIAMRAELADELKKRFSTLTVTEGFDASGNAMLSMGPGTNGGRNAIVIVKPIDWPLAKDVLGLPSTIYNPHVIQLVTEGEVTAGAGADALTTADTLFLMATVAKRGTRVEHYESAAGAAPTAAAAVVANLKATYEPELYWGLKASQ
jgi:hypothetical protein